jgi:hypothetical protein
MDILEAPSLGPPPGEGPKVGRPAIGAAQRALSDERYTQITEMLESLPPSAREFKFNVFEGSRRTGLKKGFMPIQTILYSKYKDLGLNDEPTLCAYLKQEHGSGFYVVEAYDNLNARIERIPAIKVKAGNEDDMDDDDDEYDDERPRRRRRSRGGWRQRDDWDDEDDNDTRVNLADMMSTVGRQSTAQVSQVAKSSNDMLSMLMMTQQSNAEARAAEERRRDEQRAEERKTEERRAEERRRDQEKERELRDEREERRREESKQAYEREEARRREENIRLMAESNKKTEVLLTAFTAAIPVIQKMFEPKEDKTLPLLVASMSKPPDPMLGTLLQTIIAKANDPGTTGMMMQQMMEMSKISSQMTSEQMKGMMALSNDMNGTIMKKAMEMMMASPEGKTPEGKSMIEQVMGALGSVAEIVKTLVPPSAPAPAQPRQVIRNVQHVPAQPAILPGPPATAAQGAIVPAGPVNPAVPMTPAGVPVLLKHPDGSDKTPAEVRWETLTPEQQQAETAQAPTGTHAVLGCLRAINTEQHGNQAEYQQLISYMVAQMPLDLRVAVMDGNELAVATIVMPVAKTDPEIWAWLTAEATAATETAEAKVSTLDWIRNFVKLLPASIEAVHGPADAQREQLAAGGGVAPQVGTPIVADAAAPVVEATVEANPDATPTPTGEAAPIIPGPGSTPTDSGLTSPLVAAAVASADPDEP